MKADIEIFVDGMSEDEREELAQHIRELCGNEWYTQFSISVVGPHPL